MWSKAAVVGNSVELSTAGAGARQRIVHMSTAGLRPRCRFGGGVQPVVSRGWLARRQARTQAFGARPLPLVLSPNGCRKSRLRMYKEGR